VGAVAIQVDRMTAPATFKVYPGLMSLATAARYCDMTQAEFLKAVAGGDLPQPVLINGRERWRMTDIERHFDAPEDVWQKTRFARI
jgi:hypothetical protein